MFPPGYVFDPSDWEIVSYYLPQLMEGNGNLGFLGPFSYLFNVCNVYSAKPSVLFDLDNVVRPCVKGNQRFFFSNRERIAQKNSNGKRPRRSLRDHEGILGEGTSGFWKSSTGEKPILDDGQNQIIGYVNMLNFYDYGNNNYNNTASTSNGYGKRNRKDASKTSYIMYEYWLPLPRDSFQEWVVCKIKDTCRGDEDQCEAMWLHEIFSNFDGIFQTQAEKPSLANDLEEPQQLAQEALPHGYIINNGLTNHDEQGRHDLCINGAASMETQAIVALEADEDDDAFLFQLEAQMEVAVEKEISDDLFSFVGLIQTQAETLEPHAHAQQMKGSYEFSSFPSVANNNHLVEPQQLAQQALPNLINEHGLTKYDDEQGRDLLCINPPAMETQTDEDVESMKRIVSLEAEDDDAFILQLEAQMEVEGKEKSDELISFGGIQTQAEIKELQQMNEYEFSSFPSLANNHLVEPQQHETQTKLDEDEENRIIALEIQEMLGVEFV